MNIIFLTIAHIYDFNERGIYTDLMRKFRDEGHTVYVVYPLERRLGYDTMFIEQDGIKLLGVRTLNIQKTHFIEKGIATLLLERQFTAAIRKYIKGLVFDLVLYSTPPITFTKVIREVKKRNCKSISYLLLKDIFPQNAVDIKLFSKYSLFYLLFRWKERQLYKVSDYIGCMSPANVHFVIAHNPGVDSKKVEENPNTIELCQSQPIVNKEELRMKYGIPVVVPVFIYGGNLGKPQGIDFLLTVLESNKDRHDCFFVIAGSGTEFQKLSDWFNVNNPVNAKLLKNLPKEEYDLLVASCDVGLIFLDRRFTIPNYPSRLLSYLENKMPILAATDLNTDIGTIAAKNEYGFWCESGDICMFNKYLQKLLDKKLISQMGENGYAYLVNNYQVSRSYEIIMKHF